MIVKSIYITDEMKRSSRFELRPSIEGVTLLVVQISPAGERVVDRVFDPKAPRRRCLEVLIDEALEEYATLGPTSEGLECLARADHYRKFLARL